MFIQFIKSIGRIKEVARSEEMAIFRENSRGPERMNHRNVQAIIKRVLGENLSGVFNIQQKGDRNLSIHSTKMILIFGLERWYFILFF